MGETATVVAANRPGRIPHVPALDGLRGLAVVAVLLYHQGVGWARGGYLGVSLFFTLSGFLIASLLLAEHREVGRIDLRSFWSRRVRRLAPAGLLGIGLAMVAIALAVPNAQEAAAVADVRAALVQLANWRFVLADAPYADVGTTPSPVLHYWSLAIEEQFYLVFPLVAVVALRRGRRALAVAVGVVAVASLALQVALPPTDRVYFGTDTRAAELAVGVLLALAWPRVRERVGSARLWDGVGAAGLAVTLAAWAVVSQADPRLLGGGLTVIALLSAVVLGGALGGRAVPAVLAWRPLRWLGLVSYGLYVVHFPVFLVLSPARTGLSGWGLFAVRVVVSVGLAAVSLRLVERPIRAGQPVLGLWLRGRAWAGAVLAVVAVLAVGTVGLARMAPDPGPRVTALVPGSVTVSAAGAGIDGAGAGGAAPRPPRVVVVGDSTAEANGEGLQAWAARTHGLQVTVVSRPGCAVLAGPVARYRDGFEFRPSGCEQLFPRAAEEARRIDADAVVVFIGAPQLADWQLDDEPRWRDVTDPGVADAYRDRLQGVLDDLLATDVPVLWADVPVPDWDLDDFGDLVGGSQPGRGEPVINDPARVQVLNGATAAVLDARAGAVTVPLAAGLAGPDGTIEPGDRADGLHLSAEQVAAAADDWLLDALADAHRQALAELDTAPPPGLDWTLRR